MLLHRFFRRNMTECPRCLGKGQVDQDDIKRLKKEAFWRPGKCAYCNGIGKVPQDRLEKLSVDTEYLTTDLSPRERLRLVQGEADALARANEHKAQIEQLVREIEAFYYLENLEPDAIADHYIGHRPEGSSKQAARKDMIAYIEKIIRSKRSS